MSSKVLSDAYIMTVHSLRLDYLDCFSTPFSLPLWIDVSIVAPADCFRLVTPLSLFLPDPVTKLSVSPGFLCQPLLCSSPSFDPCPSFSAQYEYNGVNIFWLRLTKPHFLHNIVRIARPTWQDERGNSWKVSHRGSSVNVLISLFLPGPSTGKHSLGGVGVVGEKFTIYHHGCRGGQRG